MIDETLLAARSEAGIPAVAPSLAQGRAWTLATALDEALAGQEWDGIAGRV